VVTFLERARMRIYHLVLLERVHSKFNRAVFISRVRLSALAQKCRRYPILILAPPSVLDNWEREFQTWGSFRTCMYAGKSKHTALRGINNGNHEVMLAGLEAFRYGS
jgi:SNF2 family DNA or RNA helicase